MGGPLERRTKQQQSSLLSTHGDRDPREIARGGRQQEQRMDGRMTSACAAGSWPAAQRPGAVIGSFGGCLSIKADDAAAAGRVSSKLGVTAFSSCTDITCKTRRGMVTSPSGHAMQERPPSVQPYSLSRTLTASPRMSHLSEHVPSENTSDAGGRRVGHRRREQRCRPDSAPAVGRSTAPPVRVGLAGRPPERSTSTSTASASRSRCRRRPSPSSGGRGRRPGPP